MHLYMLGAHHERAPIAIREQLTFNGDDLTGGLRDLAGIADEGVILSTCNRTEIYALFDHQHGDEVLREFLSVSRDIPRARLDAVTRAFQGRDAVRHIFRVASGLDSLMLGEPQILSQVQHALVVARQERSAGPILNRLCHEALRTGKLARTYTGIARNRQSISHAAVDQAARRLDGLRGRRALVIGAGQIATLTARILRNAGVADLVIVNRSPERGRALAESAGGRSAPLGDLGDELARVDAVFAAAAAPRYLIDREMVAGRVAPLVAVDLAVPRTIDPTVAEHPTIHLYTVDDLEPVAAEHRTRYERDIADAEAIAAEATEAFCAWWSERAVVPTISALHERAEEIREAELRRALRRLNHLSERDREQVAALSVAIVNKLLHMPVVQLKADAQHGTHEESTRLLRQLFGIEAEQAAGHRCG